MSQRRLLAMSLVFAVWTGTGAWAGGSIIEASTSSAPAEHQGGVYRRPLGNNPVTLDPARLNDIYGRTVANQIFDGLVQLDKTLAVRPAIAETWRASRDGLVWTFTLRKGVRFHNGREVTADDFVYSFTRILDPATHSTGASFFSNIRGADAYLAGRAARVEGLRALDRYTLQIELVESRIPFVVNLAVGFAKVVPREVVQKLGAQFGLQGERVPARSSTDAGSLFSGDTHHFQAVRQSTPPPGAQSCDRSPGHDALHLPWAVSTGRGHPASGRSRLRSEIDRIPHEAIDTLLRRARQEREMAQRLALYQEIERQVLGHAPLIVLSYAVYERLFRPQVMGIEAGALGDPQIPMKKIWLKTEQRK